MVYEALARKYRPRTFDEVVGQDPIVRTLTNAIQGARIHHAYVFSGVRGVGKTTVARIFAKALNCETGPTATPCLRCDPCLEIAAGRDLDVIEMDAASRTGVDDVRDLIDTTRYAPARDRYKVFIIDEFHMLSKPAFNALLKTLEEPPPRIVFLMATTELHKVLPTVLSRTLQFDFRKVSLADIAGQLATIAAKEGVDAPRTCLEMLARAADGSVRDAESLLDQAIAFCGATLADEDVRALLGLVPEETVEAFLASAADRDAGAMIRMISLALAEGRDLRIVHAGLIEGVRKLLLMKTLERPSEILVLAPEEETRLGTIAARFRTEELLRLFSILAGLEAPLKYSDQPRYLFEAAAIKMASIADLAPIEELISRLEGRGGGGPPSPSGGGKGPVVGRDGGPVPGTKGGPAAVLPGSGGRPAPAPRGRSKRESSDTAPSALNDEVPGTASDPASPDIDRAAAARDPETSRFGAPSAFSEEPSQVLHRLREKKETLAILIEDAAQIAIEGDVLALYFEDSRAFARKSVEQPGNLALLVDAARESAGRPIQVEIRRGSIPASTIPVEEPASMRAHGPEAPGTPRGVDPLQAPQPSFPLDSGGEPRAGVENGPARSNSVASFAPDPSGPPDSSPSGGRPGGARYQRLHALALEDPAVKRFVERFGGRIVEIKEVP